MFSTPRWELDSPITSNLTRKGVVEPVYSTLFMNDASYTEMYNFLKTGLEKVPDNEKYLDLLKLLIEKKSEYDLELLKSEVEILVKQPNCHVPFYMNHSLLKQPYGFVNNGYGGPNFMVNNNQ